MLSSCKKIAFGQYTFWGIAMLLTDMSWAESHPVRRALARPYQAWRCVAWTDEALNFLVVASRDMPERAQLPDGWLVGGPEALLDATSQLESGTFSVYVLDRLAGTASMNLCQVTGIWREQASEVPTYWYGTTAGELKPCSRAWRDSQPQPELVSVMTLDVGASRVPASR
jgi:hypothetical protein